MRLKPTIKTIVRRGNFILGHLNPGRFKLSIERVHLTLPNLPPALDGLVIAHLSDFHHSAVVPRSYLDEVVACCNALQPDLIVLTGDFVAADPRYADPCAEALAALTAPRGRFAVLGNHDHKVDARRVTEALRGVGITVLLNEGEELYPGFWVVGLDDAARKHADLPGTMARLQNAPGDVVLLLVHEPDLADEVQHYPVTLQLSGHSHGGQIRLPLLTYFTLPRLGRRYWRGLRRVGSLWLYTTRGVGMSDLLPLRLNCPPELTLLTLHTIQEG